MARSANDGRIRRAIATLVALAILVAACGRDDALQTTTTSRQPTSTTQPTTSTALQTSTAQAPEADQVLFVGNSFAWWNDGLALHFQELAASATPRVLVEADAETMGGAWLQAMWERSRAPTMIATGAYDAVILQEDLPETDVATFREYARVFVDHIIANGSEPILFMAWPYERLGWITLEAIAQAHREVATELDVAVAPVGLAWQRSVDQRPDLAMYDSDAEHPSIHGTYLAVSVVYSTVYGESPEGLTYRPEGITEEEAAYLQRIAWETVVEYQR